MCGGRKGESHNRKDLLDWAGAQYRSVLFAPGRFARRERLDRLGDLIVDEDAYLLQCERETGFLSFRIEGWEVSIYTAIDGDGEFALVCVAGAKLGEWF